jgi:hypothetical protein
LLVGANRIRDLSANLLENGVDAQGGTDYTHGVMKNISKVKGKPNLYLHVNGTYYHRTTAGSKNT